MFRKYKKEYNPKIEFKMIYSINPLFNLKDYEEMRNIFKKNQPAISDQGKMFEQLKETYEELKNMKITDIQEIAWINIFKKFDLKERDEKKIKNLIKIIQLWNKKNVPYFATKCFYEIAKNQIFNSLSYEIGFLFMNAILSQNGYIPMIIFREQLIFYKNMIEKDITLESLIELFSILQDVSMKYKDCFKKQSKKEIINQLLKIQNILIKEYQVEKIWLYGSFVHDDATPYSDVDFFIQMKDNEKKENLKKYLEQILERPVDIQIEGHYNPRFIMNSALKEREVILNVS